MVSIFIFSIYAIFTGVKENLNTFISTFHHNTGFLKRHCSIAPFGLRLQAPALPLGLHPLLDFHVDTVSNFLYFTSL